MIPLFRKIVIALFPQTNTMSRETPFNQYWSIVEQINEVIEFAVSLFALQ